MPGPRSVAQSLFIYFLGPSIPIHLYWFAPRREGGAFRPWDVGFIATLGIRSGKVKRFCAWGGGDETGRGVDGVGRRHFDVHGFFDQECYVRRHVRGCGKKKKEIKKKKIKKFQEK